MDIIDYYTNYSNMNFIDAAKELFKEANISFEFEENKQKKSYRYPMAEKANERTKADAYMLIRGISTDTLNKRDIKQDNNGNIVFEYRDQYGKLLLVKYRPARKVAKTETKTWCQKDKDTSPILFGMDKIDVTKPLLITEGECDCLACIEAGWWNTVSVPFGAQNTSWIEYNWDWLEQFEKIIIWADSDEAGEKMRNEVIPRLGEYRTYVVKSNYKDANLQLFKEGKASVLRSIESAEDIPIKGVIDLADVEDFDINKVEKIRSGFNGLDKWISGFVLGSLSIITGYNSSGKSTLLNQMCVAEPLEQGYKNFIYSGELTQRQLKSWIQFPLAGSDNIIEISRGDHQPNGYVVPKEVKVAINEWLRGNIKIYNDEEDNTAKSILRKMEQLAKKYGTKNFVIDNLMMIDLECNEHELLKKQKEFILALKRFARRYNSIVHLIAHPRKTDTIKRLSKMDIAGTGDITNLADYVISIHRVTNEEKEGQKDKNGKYIVEPCIYDIILDLHKNRHLSHQDKAVGLYFDIKSKRMYGDSDDLNKKYSWCKDNIPAMVEVEDGDFPF